MSFLSSRTRSARQGIGKPVLRQEDARVLVEAFLDALGRKVHEILDYRSPFSRPPQPPGR